MSSAPKLERNGINRLIPCLFSDRAALDAHIETEVSKANVAFYAAGGLARPLEEMDIRIHTEVRD